VKLLAGIVQRAGISSRIRRSKTSAAAVVKNREPLEQAAKRAFVFALLSQPDAKHRVFA
jgi:hypothetical protein